MKILKSKLQKAFSKVEKVHDSVNTNDVTTVLVDALEISKSNYQEKVEIFGVLQEFLW